MLAIPSDCFRLRGGKRLVFPISINRREATLRLGPRAKQACRKERLKENDAAAHRFVVEVMAGPQTVGEVRSA